MMASVEAAKRSLLDAYSRHLWMKPAERAAYDRILRWVKEQEPGFDLQREVARANADRRLERERKGGVTFE